MSDWKNGNNIGEILILGEDETTGLVYGTGDPTISEPGTGIPTSTLYIKTSNPPAIFQKQSTADLDWIRTSDGGVISVPELALPFLLQNNSQVLLPLETNLTLPFVLQNGTEIALALET